MNKKHQLLRYPLTPDTLTEWSKDGRNNPRILESDMLIDEPVLDYYMRRN